MRNKIIVRRKGESLVKRFNVTGACYPEKHYMVDISERLSKIKQMVDDGCYFAINRGRQYGKTTTLSLLKRKIESEYVVFSISFEGLSGENFNSTARFTQTFLRMLYDTIDYGEVANVSNTAQQFVKDNIEKDNIDFYELGNIISKLCKMLDKQVVLLIDEVDQASNYESFVDFLGLLRAKFLKRDTRPTFQSVILASVYDITNLKLKIRDEKEHQYNSPWNIATAFTISMDFTSEQIGTMLYDYEAEHHTGMNIPEIAQLIYDYTSGYPFMVSRICMLMDEMIKGYEAEYSVGNAWSVEGVKSAVKMLLSESNTLFDDMRKKLQDFPELRTMLYEMLYNGKSYPYVIDDKFVDIAEMFGYIRSEGNVLKLANRIFETRLYNLFAFEEGKNSSIYTAGMNDRNQFVENGHLNMRLVLERFIVNFTDLYGDNNEKFLENVGRKYFLFYLKPIINGTGNYYIEAQTRDERRTDVIVDYHGEQFVVEMKIWHGEEYNNRGEKQLVDYLNAYHLDKGYMLSFNFNKKKIAGVKEHKIGDKILIEAVV